MWRSPACKLAAEGLASGGSASGPAPGALPRALSSMRRSSGGDVTPASVDSDSDLSGSRTPGGRAVGDAPLDGEASHSIEKWAGVADDAGAGAGAGVDEALVPGADIRDAASTQLVLGPGGQAETPSGNGEQAIMASRAYQLEMLEQSLKQNVIVAIIWFITPTVSLSAQQHVVLKLQIPSVPMKMLAGNRHLPTWGQDIWSALLEKTRVVITTPQILLDALDHAYINMGHLALIVFDEVHNCIGKNPGGKIMQNHYHPCLLAGKSVPSILGLTATPSIQSNATDLPVLEQLMDARCISPTLHRDELVKCVKRPNIQHKIYLPAEEHSTPAMKSLHQAYSDLDINTDPFVMSLIVEPSEKNQRLLEKTIQKRDTFTQTQMKTFCSQSQGVCQQLGPWAADLFIWRSISSYLDKADSGEMFLDQWYQCRDREKKYLADIFRRVDIKPPPKTPQDISDISDKVLMLLEELLSMDESNTVGIIFVEERVMVKMLAEILSINPAVTKKYKIGTMVGSSSYSSKRKVVYDFGEKGDIRALQNFRSGKINLLIATSVLEEGIDVPACNLVICFDVPKTSKSFIQRRGRARMKDSKLVIFFDQDNPALQKWDEKEEEMKRLFEDEQREIQKLEMMENSESPSSICYTHPSTGARLDFDNAKSHLEHFCRVLSPTEFVDSRPDYIIHKDPDSVALTATVLLPPFIPVDPRQYNSLSSWKSEKNATKDAAFQAYMALNDAGLLNENLLPFKADEIPGIDTRASDVAVEPTMKPWHHIAPAWRETGDKWLYSITFSEEDGQVIDEYEMLLPVKLNQPPPLHLFLERGHKLELRFTEGRPVPHDQVASLPDHTSTLLALHFCHRWPKDELHNGEREHVVRIWAKNKSLSLDQIGTADFDPFDEDVKNGQYLIRDNINSPYIYKDIIECKPSISLVQNAFYGYEKAPEKGPYLVLKKWTRRTDFLHRMQGDPQKEQASSRPYSRVYPMDWAMVDSIPARHAMFGMMIPTIIHELGVMLMARELATTVLEPVGLSNWGSIPTGLRATFHTGETDLSLMYLVTKPFTGQKWRPLYLEDILQEDINAPAAERRLSTKTLADVVEALIGTSYTEGGIAMAEKCIALFLPEVEWDGAEEGRKILLNRVPPNDPLPPILEPLERLLGYTFQRKALLTEALTHASYVADNVVDTGKRSLERLEYLGDAVLDHIVVTKIFKVVPELPHYTMHTLKTGLVNGDFLAFMTMEHGLKTVETVVTDEGDVGQEETHTYLWQFMRHAASSIGIEQLATVTRHAALRGKIIDAMENGTHYPWALLAALNPKKFYSDLFEAVLGAVWIDSGSLEVCEDVCARFGLMKYLDRLLRDRVHVQHPKEELGKWANSETVVYDFHTEDIAESPGDKEFFCKVVIGERVVVEARGGVNKEEIKTKAATEALKILVEEKRQRDAEAKAKAEAEAEADGDVVMGEASVGFDDV
ncbi:dicer-like protein 2 [Trichoderma asperellum]|uniref:Dicer-like protein 2 n=1 Tax=Trichoderma asperellum TaxID=101201 RepID=A0A6V8R233_TRIAP|nr:dicer-like protein 2 [Trichoderma asperellum]